MDPSWDMLPIYYHEILPIGSQYDSHLTNGTNTTKYYSPFHSIWFPFNIPIRFPWDHIPYHEISWNGTVSSHLMHLPGERRCGPVFPQAPQREQQGRGRAGRTARSREAEGGCLAGDWATLAPCNLGNVKPNGFLKPSETHFFEYVKTVKANVFLFLPGGVGLPRLPHYGW